MTARIEKTVFISYRRTNLPWALFIYQNLTMHGYDVFFDYQSIDSGNFEKVILDNIRARAHFIVVLTSSALENCKKPGDWLRREIETAMDENRNIVPLMVENFDFGSPLVKEALTGKLSTLSTYNGLPVPNAYALEAMDRLRERYLNKALSDVPMPALQLEAQKMTEIQKSAANEAAPVEEEQLTAQTWFERGYVFADDKNLDEAIRCFTEAVRLSPNFARAYWMRGDALEQKGNLDEAIADYDQAIHLGSDNNETCIFYAFRGLAQRARNNLDDAITDFSNSINLCPDDGRVYSFRAHTYRQKGDLENAIVDFSEAIRLDPDLTSTYSGRGSAYYGIGDLDSAIEDYTEAIRRVPDDTSHYYNRALIYTKKNDYSSAIVDYQKYLDLDGGIEYGDQKEVEEKIKKLKSKLTTK
jgi:tetratricopeptide (TPR) repeat protein